MSLAEEFLIFYVDLAPSKRLEHKSPLLKCGLCLMTSFQGGQHGWELEEGGREKYHYSGESWQTSPQPGNQGEHQFR